MEKPTLNDYVSLLFSLFDRFEQQQSSPPKRGRTPDFSDKTMIVAFTLFQFRHIYQFKTQAKWLETHPEFCAMFQWSRLPHRLTLSRRYQQLFPLLQKFIPFIASYVSYLDDKFQTVHLVEDKSLFKALGPLWHQSDRRENRIPDKLRHLDIDASWGKSAYQGWVYSYGLHLTCNPAGFPCLIQVETGQCSENEVFDGKASQIQQVFNPTTIAVDNKYFSIDRLRQWAEQGILLLTPASKWLKGESAETYHRLLLEEENQVLLAQRRTSIEPLFDLIAKVLGVQGQHKQLPLQKLQYVRPCLGIATLSVQLAMIMNSIWNMPFRSISHMKAVFS